MKKNSVIFPKSKKLGHRDWGREELLVLIPKILSLKKLLIKKGKKGGLQYHNKKNECGYLLSGKLKVTYDNGSGKLKKKNFKTRRNISFSTKIDSPRGSSYRLCYNRSFIASF